MLTVAAQMFIAAWLSTLYAARSYFFVTFVTFCVLIECGKNLVDIVLQKRAASPPQSLPYTVRKAIESMGTATSAERSEASKKEKHIYRRCVFCGRKRDKKVTMMKQLTKLFPGLFFCFSDSWIFIHEKPIPIF
ncbi:hypothetical protein Tsp_05188 [Trichinella spiralis]|uniref:hypothetical protein n=1 Tax=Trichinella spiralis TaxID=6334 RepID=UPI0001EFD5B7|nr:hypothetical protein Tsp_05188 [Trichinella spiralis]